MKANDLVAKLRGVGEKHAKNLRKLGIETVGDLLEHYPRRYDDFSRVTQIAQARPGNICILGEITQAVSRRSRYGTAITEALIEDDSGSLKAVWFNQPYLKTTLPRHKPVYVAGELSFKYNQYALQNPVVEPVSSFPKNSARIVPVYPETAGVTSKQLRALVGQCLEVAVDDLLPMEIISRFKLLSKTEALRQIHFPASRQTLEAARRRLAFEEVYLLMLGSRELRTSGALDPAPAIIFDEGLAKKFVANLPFTLTDDQRKVAWQIVQDLAKGEPMNRLLQGDVGSGKTVVAALAAHQAATAGWQTALLAPTEILARQHVATLRQLFVGFNVEIDLLVSALKAAERSRTLKALAAGQLHLLIGTHALLEEAVQFQRLGLIIVDEQHRFGVAQREALRGKAELAPHVLTMSATPIPRSLALTLYGDLAISSLRTKPPGRRPVETKVMGNRAQMYRHLQDLLNNTQQVYVVCPLIEESDKLGATSVEQEVKRLQREFTSARIAGLHGRLKAAEKEAVMQRFHQHEIDILVSTTVVEVGIDVRNAAAIVIEGAERFGLATLHQLRGRVGRGAAQSYCYLATSVRGQAKQRLELLEHYQDGFILAEKDLELRGGGELYGRRQHGELDLRLAQLSNTELLENVQVAVTMTGPLEKYPKLKTTVRRRLRRYN